MRFHEILSKQMLKVSAFYLEKQKSLIPKKVFFQAIFNIKTKKLCLLTQFSVKVFLFFKSQKSTLAMVGMESLF